MRMLLTSALALALAGTALAQTSSAPSGGAPSTGAPSTAAPPPSSSPLPATPSQRNLDARPPGMPPGQTTAPPAITPDQPKSATDPRPSDQATPPSAGKRPTPGGAGSSELSTTTGRTGKNPMNESLRSCLNMWEAATHMSRQEWARACQRVDNRLQNLQIDADLSNLKTGTGANRRRRE